VRSSLLLRLTAALDAVLVVLAAARLTGE
jgi:hypothetical protein